jgi:hypothetical protein
MKNDSIDSLRLLAAHGLFPKDPKGDRRVCHGRRLHADGNVTEDHSSPIYARVDLCGHLLLHSLLERVPVRPDLHVLGTDEDHSRRNGERSDQSGHSVLGSLMASTVLGSFPIAFLYSFFVKYYVSGLTARRGQTIKNTV